ncbi:MAG: MFS transporter [Rhodospirillaceae bacterium]|nr:MFS transporter [Rhodospirillaceae bacterium]
MGIIALPAPAIGVFMRDLQADFGWTRAEISLGPSILVAILAMASPLLGWVADRFPAPLIAAVSLCALSITLFLLSRLGPSLWLYYFAFAGMALAASGSATLVYARAISANFRHGRGLALGLAMTGNGLTGILLPILLVPYAASAGWRDGFVSLSILVACAVPAVAFLLAYGARPVSDRPPDSAAQASETGMNFDDALRSRVFWLMAICFILIPLAVSGMYLHFLPFLADAGVEPAQAGLIASLTGVSLIASRILAGWLIDRFFAPYVAAAMMTASAFCIAAMAVFGAPAAILGAVAIGFSIGAELDLIGYMTARYFGMRAYGRIYGLLYIAVLAGSALSPLAYGVMVDATGSYAASLYSATVLLLVAAAIFMKMRNFKE